MSDRPTLAPETMLDRKYRLTGVLGIGGFGITYDAWDTALDRRVAIKEYFPANFSMRDRDARVIPVSQNIRAQFEHMKAGFLREGRTLASFDNPAIVGIVAVFEANGTAYMVMPFEPGPSLRRWLTDLGRAPSQEELDRLAVPLLDALTSIHAAGYLHRDIAPDNIIVRPDGSPVLLDFGAARRILHEVTGTVTGLVKRGFSPQEQYSTESRLQGPWTDIYALGATFHQCVTGAPPEDATARMLAVATTPTSALAAPGFRDGFLDAIDWALQIHPQNRPQTIDAWRPALGCDAAVVPEGAHVDEPASLSRIATGGEESSAIALAKAARWSVRSVLAASAIAATALSAFVLLRQPSPATIAPAVPSKRAETPSRAPPSDAKPSIAVSEAGDTYPRIDAASASFRDCPSCPQMVIIPAGTFSMGSPETEEGRGANEGPARQITFRTPFAMAKLETTRAAWRRFVSETSHKGGNDCRALQFSADLIDAYETGRATAEWKATGEYSWENTNYPQDDDHPVACVSYEDVADYLSWLNTRTPVTYRLPSESEWEYAARAGSTEAFSAGPRLHPEDARYHYPSTYRGSRAGRWVRGTAPAGSFSANAFGLHDMHGNVWEWVADCAGGSLSEIPQTGAPYLTAACDTAVLRGGAFWTSPQWTRSAFRYAYQKRLRGAAAGFRVARDLRPEELTRLAPLPQKQPQRTP